MNDLHISGYYGLNPIDFFINKTNECIYLSNKLYLYCKDRQIYTARALLAVLWSFPSSFTSFGWDSKAVNQFYIRIFDAIKETYPEIAEKHLARRQFPQKVSYGAEVGALRYHRDRSSSN
jgi:hypothetical protein